MPEIIERVYLGHPSGRQEIDNLRKWFNYMTQNHSNLDDLNAIYTISGQELIRQISVHCIERGELLKELLNRFPSLIKLKDEEQALKLKAEKQRFEEAIEKIKKNHEKDKLKNQEKIGELKGVIDKTKDSKLKLAVDALLMKNK